METNAVKYDLEIRTPGEQHTRYFSEHSSDWDYFPTLPHDWKAEIKELIEMLCNGCTGTLKDDSMLFPEGWEPGDDIDFVLTQENDNPDEDDRRDVEYLIRFVEIEEDENGLAQDVEQRGPGRPTIGKTTSLTLRPDQLAWLDAQPRAKAETVRRLIDEKMALGDAQQGGGDI